MVHFLNFTLYCIECFRGFFMFTSLFFIILNKEQDFIEIPMEKLVHESVCIGCTQQFWLQDLFDLVLLEHRVRDVLTFVCTKLLDVQLRLDHFREDASLALSFLTICEEYKVLHHRPTQIENENSDRIEDKDGIQTHFSVFSSKSHLDILVNSATFSCGKN